MYGQRTRTISYTFPASAPLVLGDPDGRSIPAVARCAFHGLRTGDKMWVSGTGVEVALLRGELAPLDSLAPPAATEPVTVMEPPRRETVKPKRVRKKA